MSRAVIDLFRDNRWWLTVPAQVVFGRGGGRGDGRAATLFKALAEVGRVVVVLEEGRHGACGNFGCAGFLRSRASLKLHSVKVRGGCDQGEEDISAEQSRWWPGSFRT